MKKWLIPLFGLTLALATAGTIMAFNLTGGGSGTPEQGPAGAQEPAVQGGEPSLGPPLVPADDCNDPNGSVSIIRDDGTGNPAVICLPGDDTGTSDLEPGQEPAGQVEPLPPIRSDEGIDPNECNLVHNINACDEDELKSGGVGVPLQPIRSDEADSPVISGGSTLPSGATPQPSLTFEGVKYTYSESFGAASEGEASKFDWPNARINAEDMELVGTTAQANTHWTSEQRLQGFLRVYRLKGGVGTDVYSFTPAETSTQPECNDPHQGDAQQPCDETAQGYWIQWTAKSDLDKANSDLPPPDQASDTPVGITNVSQAHNEPDTEPAVVSTPNSPTEIVSETTEKFLAQPPQPVIRLHYGGQVYDGVPGNFCWPVAPGGSLCGDEGPFPWQDLDLSTMPVTAGDSIIVEIEADDRPQKLQARIFAEASDHASDTAVQVVELDPGLKAPLAVDLPSGVYNMRIIGQWGVGDQAYKFRMKVE